MQTSDISVSDAEASALVAPTRRAEFARSWPVVVNAAAGCGLGISGIITYNSGLFVNDLGAAIGLTRTQFGITFFLTTLAIAVALPFVGRLIDLRGARRPALFGSLALAAGFFSLGSLTQSVAIYMTLMVLTGLLASPSSPVAYTRAVNAAFDRARGLALGFTQVGIGIAAAIVPPLVLLVIGQQGWQMGFYLLGVIALLGVVPALFGLRDQPAAAAGERAAGAAVATAFDAILRGRLFWMQLTAFSVMALAFAGLLAHFVPILRDAGLSTLETGVLASLIGISVIVSRIVIGWLADFVDARRLMVIVCAICALGCLALAVGGTALAPLAAIALGIAMGAEADLLGYFTARYFGMGAYGRAYGWQYSAFILAAGLSPVWVGWIADLQGNYTNALFGSVLLLMVALLLFLLLPPFPRRAEAG